jgi:hypothetical protein
MEARNASEEKALEGFRTARTRISLIGLSLPLSISLSLAFFFSLSLSLFDVLEHFIHSNTFYKT